MFHRRRLLHALGWSLGTTPVAASMLLGGNINGSAYWTSPLVFANICRYMTSWSRTTGSGAFTDTRGALSGIATNTDVFRATLTSGNERAVADWPTSGLWTVRWTGKGQVRIATGAPTTMSNGTEIYKSAVETTDGPHEATFTLNKSSVNGVAAYIQFSGSGVATPGLPDVKVIQPGMVTSFDAGNEFSPIFTSALIASKIKLMRFMDTLATNTNLDRVWADRCAPTDVRWVVSQGGADVIKWPWETIVALANLVGIDPWINLPAKVDSTYRQNVGAIFATSNRTIYVENTNEGWNGQFDQTGWLRYAHVATQQATGDGAATPTWSLTGHGLSAGDTLMLFNDKDNTTSPTYPLKNGGTAVVKTSTLTADTFQLATTAGGAALTSTTGHNKLLFKKIQGQTAALDVNYAAALEQVMTDLEVNCPRAKLKYVCGAKAVDPANALVRFNGFTAGGKLKVDHVAIAPYVHPFWFEATLAASASGGTVTPTFSNSFGTVTFKYATYLASATPTNAEIFAGTGAIASNLIGTAVANTSATVAGSALTGHTTSTNYNIYVWADYDGVRYLSSMAFTQLASGAISGACTPSYQDFSNSHTIESTGPSTDGPLGHPANIASFVANMASAGLTNAKLVAYEGFEEWTNAQTARYQSTNPVFAAFEDSSYANVLKEYLYNMASMGIEKFNVWSLMREDPYGLAQSASVLTTSKWSQYISFAGTVQKFARPAFKTLAPPDLMPIVVSDPGSYPTTIFTLGDSTGANTIDAGAITYSIIGGNEYGWFDISGNSLRLVSNPGAGVPATLKIKMLAGGKTSSYISLPVVLGIGTPAMPNANTSYENNSSAAALPLNTSAGSSSTLAFKNTYTNSNFGYVNLNGVFQNQPILNGLTITISYWAYRDAADSSDIAMVLQLYLRNYNSVGAPSSSVVHSGVGTFLASSSKTFNGTLTKYTFTYTNNTGVTLNDYTAGAPAGTSWLQLQLLKNSAADGITRHVNIFGMTAKIG